ncbi:MAG: CZB domain-containing protein [Maritimibacter sp.]|nr:CZB domain-containing protein [Maritimibacter sp.]
MTTHDLEAQIDDAIRAHTAVRRTLEIAIGIGHAHASTDTVGDDHRCAFGRWLHGPLLGPEVKAGRPFEVVNRLHGEFHREAQRVATEAAAGHREEAERLLHTDFAAKSDVLLRALHKWRGEASR